jgi:prolyl oligopeptidase
MRLLIVPISALALMACADSAPTTETAMTETENASVTMDKPAAAGEDPYLWLEEVEGEDALAWVTSQNERSLADLKAKPHYAKFEAAALEVATSNERIPYGSIRDGQVYNFWQDETNTRGLWRRTSLDSYSTASPTWETVLDFDKLSETEGKNWVYKGADCFKPEGADRYLCMVSLSDGGKDAVIQREFDLKTKTFVENGFVTPEAKQGTAWVDADTQLVGTDWGEGTTTESGYPFVVKRWARGTPLSEAKELIRGQATDVGVWPMTMELEDGRVLQGAVEAETFFTSTYWLFPSDGSEPVKWPIPLKSQPEGVYKGKMLVSLQQDWAPDGQSERFNSGDLVAFDLDEFLTSKTLPPVALAFRPNERQAVNGVSIAKGAALLSINDNVVGKVLRLEPQDSGWTTEAVDLPGTGQAGIAFADKDEETVFLNYEGFLTPDSLLRYDVGSQQVSPLKSLPEKFNTDGLKVEQFFAESPDGTEIPYFVVHRADITLDGSTPTLLYGYGGFQVSLNPSYSATIGRLWLEEGGAYVLANIRGGGEFGPKWHQAGLKGDRQRIYDDFIAVGEDIVAKGITKPEHLGIMGGSNGGLLMGVMLNQRPDLWNAVVVQVPLLDMLRYHTLLAGASWVDEYGSPDVPEERAFLETISPYQNFDADKPYPTPLFVTSTKDDRVHPGHARKMAKKFEAAGLPFLYYENIDGGHSAAANQKERAKRSALEFTYLKDRLFPSE